MQRRRCVAVLRSASAQLLGRDAPRPSRASGELHYGVAARAWSGVSAAAARDAAAPGELRHVAVPWLPCRGVHAAADPPAYGGAKPRRRRAAKHAAAGGEAGVSGVTVLDPGTVAMLSRKGFGTAQEVAAMLQTRVAVRFRFHEPVATAALAWLEARLGAAQPAGARAGAQDAGAAVAVRRFPLILSASTDRLQTSWDFMQRPPPNGLGLAGAQLHRVVAQFPQLFVRSPEVMTRNVALLTRLGVSDLPRLLMRSSNTVGLSAANVEAKAALLREFGMDAGAVLNMQPGVVNLALDNLRLKLTFFRDVAGCNAEQLRRMPVALQYSLDERIRPRFFLAQQQRVRVRTTCDPVQDTKLSGMSSAKKRRSTRLLEGVSLSTLLQRTDAAYLALLEGSPAAGWSVAQYKAHTQSAAFKSWAAAREAELLAMRR